MGFRSTFITEDYPLKMPDWFREKYGRFVFFDAKGYLPIASRVEIKTYSGLGAELAQDLQRILIAANDSTLSEFVLVWLHECGGVTRVEIHKDKILYSEPVVWEKVEDITHDYCYGCSDVSKIA